MWCCVEIWLQLCNTWSELWCESLTQSAVDIYHLTLPPPPPPPPSTHTLTQYHPPRFDIVLMKEGRMKGQAFVGLPSEKSAEKALRDTNGYVLFDKPLVVVSFLVLSLRSFSQRQNPFHCSQTITRQKRGSASQVCLSAAGRISGTINLQTRAGSSSSSAAHR